MGDTAPATDAGAVTSTSTGTTGGGTCADGVPDPGQLCVPALVEYAFAGGRVLDLDAGDLDGDGSPDLVAVVGGYGAPFHGVQWFRNNGAGGLVGPSMLAFENPSDFSGMFVVSVDLDDDGDLDLYADGVGGVRVFENDGAGNFDVGPVTFSGPDELCIDGVPGDFDGNGRVDLALACVTPQNTVDLRIVWGAPSGPVSEDWLGVLDAASGQPAYGMAATDIDADGDDDVLLLDPDAGEVGIVLGDASRALSPAGAVGVGPGFYGIAARDFDRDGRGDFVIVHRSNGTYAVFFGRDDGSMSEGPRGEVSTPTVDGSMGPPPMPAIGDWDGDGRDDLMVGMIDPFPVVVFDLLAPMEHPRQTVGAPYGLVSVAVDLDSDGVDDVVVADQSSPATLYVGLVEP